MISNLALLVVLSLSFAIPGTASAYDGGGGIRLAPISLFPQGMPRQPLTLLFRVGNSTPDAIDVVPSLTLPEGWTALVPPPTLRIEAGDELVNVISVLPAVTAVPGEYLVELAYSRRDSGDEPDSRAKTTFVVRIAPSVNLGVEWIDAPAYSAGEPYTAVFTVYNAGNVTHALRLAAEENLGLAVEVVPDHIILEPGGRETVEVRVNVPNNTDKLRRHRLRLLVTDSNDSAIRLSETVWVDLLPVAHSSWSSYHFFPLRLNAKVSTDFVNSVPSFEWKAQGRGRITDQDPGVLEVEIGEAKWSVRYDRDALSVSAGDQQFQLSPLTLSGARGKGLAVRFEREAWRSQAIYFQDSNLDTQLGASVAYQATERLELALHGAGRANLPGGRWSASARVTPQDGWSGELEVGLNTSPSPEQASPVALMLSGTVDRGAVRASAKWEQSDAGYRGTSAGRSMDLRQTWRIADDYQLALGWNEKTRFAHGFDSDILSQRAELTAAIRASLPSGRWNLGYRYVESDPGESFNRNVSIAWSRSLGPSLGRLSAQLSMREKQESDSGARTSWGDLRITHRLPWGNGQLSSSLRIEDTLYGERADRIGLGVAWFQRFGSGSINLSLQARDLLTGEVRFRGRFTYGDRTGGLFHADALYRTAAGTTPSIQVRAGYSFTLDFSIPTSRRSDVGSVRGRLVDENGAGVAGILVHLSGQVARTDADGSYYFPSVPAGEAVISVDPRIVGVDRAVVPALPYKLTIEPRLEVIQDFTLVRTGSVLGYFEIEPMGGNGNNGSIGANGNGGGSGGNGTNGIFADAVYGEGRELDLSALDGIVVELRGDAGVRRTVVKTSNGNGLISGPHFRFDHVLPGEWDIVVYRNGLPDVYMIAPENQRATVRAGSPVEVVIKVIPVRREIQFREGGVVGSINL